MRPGKEAMAGELRGTSKKDRPLSRGDAQQPQHRQRDLEGLPDSVQEGYMGEVLDRSLFWHKKHFRPQNCLKNANPWRPVSATDQRGDALRSQPQYLPEPQSLRVKSYPG